MIKRGIVFNMGVALIYFFSLCLLRWKFSFSWEILLFLFGGMLGTFLLDLDYFIYVFYTKPEETFSLEARGLFKEKRYKAMFFSILGHKDEQKQLVLHSAVFGPVLFIFALFVLTSSGSFWGAGLVLGIYLNYLLNLWRWYKEGEAVLKERFFWQKDTEMDQKSKNIFLLLLFLGFIFSSFLFTL